MHQQSLPGYVDALAALREATLSDRTVALVALLVRVAAMSPAAGAALARLPLRTRQDRVAGAIAAALAMAEEDDATGGRAPP